MRIKTKVTLGVVFLFTVILVMGGLGLYYLNKLSNDSQNILKNNYESLEYMKGILDACDQLPQDSLRAIALIEKNITAQEGNITEGGERDLTILLRTGIEKLKLNSTNTTSVLAIRKHALEVQEINMKAIVRKNEITQKTADRASTFLIIIGTIVTIIVFTFIVNFPGYVANPIVQLTTSIKAIANKDYEERLHFDRQDEFEELAEAFNRMAEKLDEYEHSNLANVLFEKKRIETIINRMNDPVIGLDETKKIVFANTQALSLLNLDEEKTIGRYAPDVALENDLLRNLIRPNTNPSESVLIKIVLQGKENYFSKESISIRYNPTGEKETIHIGEVILLKNVTPFKELDLAKTNFIATISHELKTPIASLQMCTKLLQDNRVGELNAEQKSILQTLQDETGRLSSITHELLDLAQVETGNIKLNLQKTSADDILIFALESVKFQAERKGIQLVKSLNKNLPLIFADIEKTTWVLTNLLTNAIRYSPENGKIMIQVFAESDRVKFQVEDFGTGIEEKHLDKIFDRFYQVPGTTQGTGLGLAISKEFIEAQGGRIGVRSEFGKGSTFEFDLRKA